MSLPVQRLSPDGFPEMLRQNLRTAKRLSALTQRIITGSETTAEVSRCARFEARQNTLFSL